MKNHFQQLHSNLLYGPNYNWREGGAKRTGDKGIRKDKTRGKSKGQGGKTGTDGGGEWWVVYELPKDRSAVAGRHSLISHYSHQASGTATLVLCVRARVSEGSESDWDSGRWLGRSWVTMATPEPRRRAEGSESLGRRRDGGTRRGKEGQWRRNGAGHKRSVWSNQIGAPSVLRPLWGVRLLCELVTKRQIREKRRLIIRTSIFISPSIWQLLLELSLLDKVFFIHLCFFESLLLSPVFNTGRAKGSFTYMKKKWANEKMVITIIDVFCIWICILNCKKKWRAVFYLHFISALLCPFRRDLTEQHRHIVIQHCSDSCNLRPCSSQTCAELKQTKSFLCDKKKFAPNKLFPFKGISSGLLGQHKSFCWVRTFKKILSETKNKAGFESYWQRSQIKTPVVRWCQY